jgi:hypothetical protein
MAFVVVSLVTGTTELNTMVNSLRRVEALVGLSHLALGRVTPHLLTRPPLTRPHLILAAQKMGPGHAIAQIAVYGIVTVERVITLPAQNSAEQIGIRTVA